MDHFLDKNYQTKKYSFGFNIKYFQYVIRPED